MTDRDPATIIIKRYIVCPYCRHIDRETDVDDAANVKCPACHMVFRVYVMPVADYCTHRNCRLNDLEHEWVEVQHSDGGSHLACTKCDETRSEVSDGQS